MKGLRHPRPDKGAIRARELRYNRRMDRPRHRPRFELEVGLPADRVSRMLEHGLQTAECPCVGSVTRRHAWIHIRDEDRHFWSPTLDLTLEEVPDGTVLRGRFAPHPSIWTGFVFIYAALGVLGTIAAMYGIAQLTLGQPALGFAVSLGCAGLIGFVYGAAFIGQGLGSDQMTDIRIFLDRCVGRIDVQAEGVSRAQG